MALRSKYPNVTIPEDLSWPDFVFHDFDRHKDRTATVCATTERSYTFSQVFDLSRRFASALTRRGFNKGEVAAIFIPNAPEFVIVFFGILQAGGVVTGVNPLFTTQELTNQLRKAKAHWIFSSHQLIHRAKEAAQTLEIDHVFVLGEVDGFESVSDLLKDDGSRFPNIRFSTKEDVAILPFSSGVSGVPKCVVLTHHNLVSLGSVVCAQGFLNFTETSIILADIPFYGTFGMIAVLSLALRRGSCIVSVPRFDQNKFFHQLQDYQVTHLCTDASRVNLLSTHPAVDNFDLKSLIEVMTTATAVNEEVSRNVMNRIPQLNRINQCYGMTENSTISHMTPSAHVKHGSVGVLLPNLECKVIDVTNGKVLGTGEQGEICIKGPTLMKGYCSDQKATSQAIDNDGWLHTGDIGYYDNDQHFFIVDKFKEVIKFKGHQVSAAELESVIRSHPAVKDAVVVGIPHPESGELPMAFVISKNEQELTDIEIMQFVDENVAPHKKLRGGVEFINSFPLSSTGSVLRSDLRARARKRKVPDLRLRRMSSFRTDTRRVSTKRQSIWSTGNVPGSTKVTTVTAPSNSAPSRTCVIL